MARIERAPYLHPNVPMWIHFYEAALRCTAWNTSLRVLGAQLPATPEKLTCSTV